MLRKTSLTAAPRRATFRTAVRPGSYPLEYGGSGSVAIDIDDLWYRYPSRTTWALSGITLHLDSPGLCVLLGPSASGKTTLLRLLAAQAVPSRGVLRIDGLATVAHRLPLREHLGYIPQELGLPRELTLREYLTELLRLDGVPDGELPERIGRIAEALHLTSALDRRLARFSGGMKRRALIAQALVRQVRLLLADEPTSGLDPEEQTTVLQLLRAAAATRCVVVATHRVATATDLAGRLCLLDRGRLVSDLPTPMLAEEARGWVWGVPAGQGLEDMGFALPTPDPGRLRLIAPRPPAGAVPLPPSAEDGYFALLWRFRHGETKV